MKLSYFRQAIRTIKENPYPAFISIMGIALSIGMIMSLLVANRAKTMDLEPENNRTRSLYVKWVGVKEKSTGNHVVNGFMSLKTIRECFQSLKTPEAVTVSSFIHSHLATLPGGDNQKRCYVLYTDDVFWKVFDFKFIDGNGYNKQEFDSGIKKIVISKQLARTMFGTTENVIGKQMQLNYITYTVSGVVQDLSPITVATYAHAWIPYTSVQQGQSSDSEGITGMYKCQIIAHSSGDFDAIRKEVEEQTNRYNTTLANYKIEYYGQPDTRYVEDHRFGAGYLDMKRSYLSDIGLVLILLLVPAINLSGLTLSRMRKRTSELGVRKAYGANKNTLMGQVLSEQMVYSLIGGALGLLISFTAVHFISDFGFNQNNYFGLDIQADFNPAVFITPVTFLLTFAFCLIINLLSAGIPAWKVSSAPIVESLRED
jgi:putative ABC transport system permease protein